MEQILQTHVSRLRKGTNEEVIDRRTPTEVVVRHVHHAFRGLTSQIGRPLLGAREIPVGGTERCLPNLAEFVQDVWDFGLVGVVVHEYNYSFPHQDHV